MSLQHTYVKERRLFGRPVKFFLRSEVLADYQPVKNEAKRFLTKWTMDKSTEERAQFAVVTVNTERTEYVSRGMCHVEGGYSKDIDINDEEQTLRYKKKLQRSEEYRIEMTRNLESMKKAVMQNAAVNIYENYFESCADGAKVVQCFRHPNVMCSASKVSLSIEQSPKIAVAYSDPDLQKENVICPLIWDITQNECMEMNCESSCSTLAYHKKYWNTIAGGLQNGKVCLWDVRNATEPFIVADQRHNGYVSCLQWSHKCNYQMLTGSSSGEVFWWDIRKMNSSPCQFKIDRVDGDKIGLSQGQTGNLSKKRASRNRSGNLDIGSTELYEIIENACTSLEFDKVHKKNIRIGTGDGRIIVAQKNEGKIEKLYESRVHEDPVSTIAQNRASYKCILTVDGCDIKVWDEDMTTDPIFTMSSIVNEFTCGAWSLTRYSRFFIGKVDGSIQFWDLTFNHTDPYFSFKPTSSRVNDIQTNNYGTLVASCHNNGDVYALELVDNTPGTVRDFTIEEMNFDEDDGGEQQ